MRLSELLAKEVVDASGQRAGHVHDVRVIQDGTVGSSFDADLRVHALVIGRGGVANRLGYGRGARGPWLVRAILEGLHRPTLVPWTRIRAIESNRIVISGSRDDLERATPRSDAPGTTRG